MRWTDTNDDEDGYLVIHKFAGPDKPGRVVQVTPPDVSFARLFLPVEANWVRRMCFEVRAIRNGHVSPPSSESICPARPTMMMSEISAEAGDEPGTVDITLIADHSIRTAGHAIGIQTRSVVDKRMAEAEASDRYQNGCEPALVSWVDEASTFTYELSDYFGTPQAHKVAVDGLQSGVSYQVVYDPSRRPHTREASYPWFCSNDGQTHGVTAWVTAP